MRKQHNKTKYGVRTASRATAFLLLDHYHKSTQALCAPCKSPVWIPDHHLLMVCCRRTHHCGQCLTTSNNLGILHLVETRVPDSWLLAPNRSTPILCICFKSISTQPAADRHVSWVLALSLMEIKLMVMEQKSPSLVQSGRYSREFTDLSFSICLNFSF